jgi:Spherulation-specific family 4
MRQVSSFSRFVPVAGAWLSASVGLGGCSDGGQASPMASGGAAGASGIAAASASAGTGGGAVSGSGNGGGAAGDGSLTTSGGAGSASSGAANGGAGTGTGGHAGNTAGGAASSGGAGGGNAGGSSAAGSAGASGSGGQASTKNGCIVPLYTYPSDPTWSTIVQAKQAHAGVDVVAIVNPSNGPGNGVDKTFTTGIAKLVAAGVVPIGYVSTNYTKRGQTAVNADSDTWRASYPAVQGIFFDEQSVTAGDEAFYAAVAAHAKGKGFTLTVGNPGTNVPSSFLGALDVMLSYESAGAPTLGSLSQYAAHRDQFGIIPYATTFDATYVKAAAKSVRYVFLTNDDLPNPWDTLPSYFDALLGALGP